MDLVIMGWWFWVIEWDICCCVWDGLQVGEEDMGEEGTVEGELGTTRGMWERGHEEEWTVCGEAIDLRKGNCNLSNEA